jgi:hypothetical protein
VGGVAEIGPGVLKEILGGVGEDAMLRSKTLLTKLALEVETRAKKNASNGSHERGTPTPAQRGQGPAVISGTLRRSITHEPVKFSGITWFTRVGTMGGLYAPYNHDTPSSLYGWYLEHITGYPFLEPAAKAAFGHVSSLSREVFGAPWKKTP